MPGPYSPTLLLCCFLPLFAAAAEPPRVANAADVGAVGDGKTLNTVVIQGMIDRAAASAGGGEILFPPGVYLTGSLVLKSHVTLHLAQGATLRGSPRVEDYPIVTARWEGIERPCHRALVSARDAEDIAVEGAGIVEGDPSLGPLRDPRGPTLIEPIACRHVRVEGVTLKNTGVWTLHPTYCEDVAVSRVSFATTGYNSDGLDPDSCRGVSVSDCTFSTDDDCIAIKSGKGQEGVRIGRPCEDITIRGCTFLKGYCSVAVGSELSGGIRHVLISGCTFKNGRAALYVKTTPGRAGYVHDIILDHATAGPEPLLEIETAYPFNVDPQGVPGAAGLTGLGGIAIRDATVASEKGAVMVQATPERPVEGLILSRITGTCARGCILRNVDDAQVEDIRIDGVTGPLLRLENVTGTGLEHAGSLPLPATPARSPE